MSVKYKKKKRQCEHKNAIESGDEREGFTRHHEIQWDVIAAR